MNVFLTYTLTAKDVSTLKEGYLHLPMHLYKYVISNCIFFYIYCHTVRKKRCEIVWWLSGIRVSEFVFGLWFGFFV